MMVSHHFIMIQISERIVSLAAEAF
jgi:hypothetical protein